MTKRIKNIASYDTKDYHQAPSVQQRIDVWRSIYGSKAILINHILEGGWYETVLSFDSMLGSNVVSTIGKDINDYIEADEYKGGYALNALVALV